MKRARILIADDHSITLAGIRSLIEPNWELAAYVRDGLALVTAALTLKPDLIILDISMPLLSGLDAARKILGALPDAKLLFLTMHSNTMLIREAMKLGASGYILKTSAAEELRPAIRKILSGGSYFPRSLRANEMEGSPTQTGITANSRSLTARQKEVLRLVAEGKANKEIAPILHISVKTVEFHRGQLMQRLGLHTVAQLTAFALRNGIAANSDGD